MHLPSTLYCGVGYTPIQGSKPEGGRDGINETGINARKRMQGNPLGWGGGLS